MHYEILICLAGIVMIIAGLTGGGFSLWKVTMPKITEKRSRNYLVGIGAVLAIVGLLAHLFHE